ncbi:MAG: hypothetical protein RLY86_3138 [Pseudomonadota bacterium]|jgi:hypothetical protein
MPIRNDQELERAVQEFQRLRAEPDDSPDGRRRQDLDAEIKAYYLQHGESLRPAKPPS